LGRPVRKKKKTKTKNKKKKPPENRESFQKTRPFQKKKKDTCSPIIGKVKDLRGGKFEGVRRARRGWSFTKEAS